MDREIRAVKLTARSWRPRWSWTLFAVAVIAAAPITVPSTREPLLRSAGWALVGADPLEPADIIVISADSGGAGALEAADLVQSGIATQVAVFADPPSGEDLEFIRRGLPYEDEAERQTRQLKWLGVTNIVRIPRTEAGTEGEAEVLPQWCTDHQIRSLAFVGARDHSRRLQWVFARTMRGHMTRVAVQPSRYSSFDPDGWWKSRTGIRIQIVEFQKLMLEIVLHPFSF